ncbi:MAG: ferrous iron transporter B [Cystobacterineae bacterium]|nr:ferrous iron transporter B [Cystobacterineae bacterium]
MDAPPRDMPRKTLLVVGNPNVGKSVLFNAFTGRYAVVSNYPGTTVELMQGNPAPSPLAGGSNAEAPLHTPLQSFATVIDTPGMYALCPLTEEERVSQHILLEETFSPGGGFPQRRLVSPQPAEQERGAGMASPLGSRGGANATEESHSVLLHVVDAKNLHRALPLTLQLLELQKPMVLALNLYDEALAEGMEIDALALSQCLGIPAVNTVATRREGLKALYAALEAQARAPEKTDARFHMQYSEDIELALLALCSILSPLCGPQSRAIALLLLQGDAPLLLRLKKQFPAAASALQSCLEEMAPRLSTKTALLRIATQRHEAAHALAESCIRPSAQKQKSFWALLSRMAMAPATGIPLLLVALYLGLYQFVGVFGAGVLVDFLEGTLFGKFLLPPFQAFLKRIFAGEEGAGFWARELLGGEYGLVSLGLKYALAVILPIVASFFFFFSLLEDSGYFPRLALLADRAFKWIGLNGRAIIPLVLGVGCGTMATLVTRIQETKRERLITIVLLALAVPCSAQYGIISSLLIPEGGAFAFPTAFLLWLGVVAFFFTLTGALLSRLLPGESASFYMEIPPMRMPMLKNVFTKTAARLKWYFWEVLPIFLLASFLIWVGRLSGLFGWVISLLSPAAQLLGLPAQTAEIFLFGFFRRDLGAAGLLDMKGALSLSQTFVACITLTLFLPCVAQFLMMKRERGWKTALSIGFFVAAVAFGAGKLSGSLLEWTGVQL